MMIAYEKQMIIDKYNQCIKLHNECYGNEFLNKLLNYIEKCYINVSDALDILEALNDLDPGPQKMSIDIKTYLYHCIEKKIYSSGVLDTIYKWQYAKA